MTLPAEPLRENNYLYIDHSQPSAMLVVERMSEIKIPQSGQPFNHAKAPQNNAKNLG